MSGGSMEFGIRITTDGKVAAAEAKSVDAALANTNKTAAAAAAQVDKIGMSAKQTSAALRGVPAQFTDIVTQLSAGQAPLQVLIQQGGQLKDMFGGLGPAARALGGYVAGLINPFTIAAAAATGLGYAYYKGSQEADSYRKAIVLTGNAAGTSASQLAAAAVNISQHVGTQAKAAEALTALTATGRVASGNLQKFAQVAVETERATGQSVDETVKNFEALGKSPVEASLKLNDTLHYLTANTFAQIKAAQDLGDTEKAASIAQNAYADAQATRNDKIVENLGILERSWNAVKSAAGGAWNAMLNVGREQSLDDKLKSLQSQLVAAANSNNPTAAIALANQIHALQAQQAQTAATQQSAAATAAATKVEEARIKWLVEGDKYLTQQAQMERDIAAARTLGVAAGKSQAEIEERIGAIRVKYGSQSQLATEYQSRIDLAKRAGEREVAALAEAHEQGLIGEEDYQKQITQIREAAISETIRLTGEQYSKTIDPAKRKELITQMQALTADWVKSEEEGAGRIAAAHRKWMEESGKGIRDYADSLAQAAGAAELANQNYGLTDAHVQQLAISEAEAAKATALHAIEMLRASDASQEAIDAYQQQIDYLDQIIAARTRIANAADIKRQKDQEVDLWRSAESAAHSTWTAIGRDGNNTFKQIGQTLKASILDVLYQLTIKRWIVNISAQVSGSGVAGSAFPNSGGMMPGGGIGGGSSFSGFPSGGSSLFAGTSFGAGWQAGSALSYSQGYGAITESLAQGQYGQAAGIAGAQYLPWVGAAYAASQGQWGTAAGTAIGSIWGPAGAAVGAFVGSLVDGFIGGGGEDPHNNGQVNGYNLVLGKSGAKGIGYISDSDTGYAGSGPTSFTAGPTSGSGWWGDVNGLTQPQIEAINQQVAAMFATGGELAKALGIDPSVLDSASASSATDGVASNGHIGGYFASIDQALGALGDDMAHKLVPEIDKYRNANQSAWEAIVANVSAVQALRAQFDAFKDQIALGDLSDLDPLSKYRLAKDLYNKALEGKDAAAVTQTAQQFLQASRAAFASSDAYAADYQSVIDSVTAFENNATKLPWQTGSTTAPSVSGQQVADNTAATVTVLQSGLTQLIAAITAQGQTLDTIKSKLGLALAA